MWSVDVEPFLLLVTHLNRQHQEAIGELEKQHQDVVRALKREIGMTRFYAYEAAQYHDYSQEIGNRLMASIQDGSLVWADVLHHLIKSEAEQLSVVLESSPTTQASCITQTAIAFPDFNDLIMHSFSQR